MASVEGLAPERTAIHKGFWNPPLGCSQAAFVAVCLISAGIWLQWLIGPVRPAWYVPPVILALSVALAVVARRKSGSYLMQWLSGVPFAVTTVIFVCLMSVAGGFFHPEQLKKAIGVESVFGSWPFALLIGLMSVNLICVCARRCYPLSFRNVSFLCNHLGLLTALFGGLLSATTIERLRVFVREGNDTNIAYSASGKEVRLPFSMRLEEFNLKTFPATLGMATLDKSEKSGYRLEPSSEFLNTGASFTIGDYSVKVDKYLSRAAEVGGVFREVAWKSGAPAALVSVFDKGGKRISQGWVSCGSMITSGAVIPVTAKRAIVMPKPRPKVFHSKIMLKEEKQARSVDVRVNQPFDTGGYKLYQLSYDEVAGADSRYSILEVVQDRGLPIVYAGIYLTLIGAALMMWSGAREVSR